MARARRPPKPNAKGYSSALATLQSYDVIASAERLDTRGGVDASQKLRRVAQPWQQQALAYYDRIGEIHYAARFHGNALSKLRLYVGVIDDEGEIKPSEDEKAKAILGRLRTPSGSRAPIQSAYGVQMFLTGEPLLLWWMDGKVEKWEVVSTDEILVDSNGRFTRRTAPGIQPVVLREPEGDRPPSDGEAVVWRLHRPHPRWSELADAPMRGVLHLCKELVLLELAVEARATSRLTESGMVLIASEITMEPTTQAVGDEDPQQDILIAEITKHIVTPIADPGSASAQVPYFLRVGSDLIAEDKAVRPIKFHDPTTTYPEENLRTECIRRIALGLDFPPEVLLGMTDANHWTAWQVEQQTWKSHLLPVSQMLVDDLTSAYLRPMAEAEGIADWESLVVAFDAADILTNPDKAKDAEVAHKAGVIGDEALRDAMGFKPTEKQTDEERNVWLAIQLRDKTLAGFEPDPAPVVANPMDASQSEQLPPDEDKGEEPPDEDENTTASIARILGAAGVTFQRARELAGARLMAFVQHNQEIRDGIREVPASLVASALAGGYPELARPEPIVLVAGAARPLVEALKTWDVPAEQAEALGSLIERHAARTLEQTDPEWLPAGFQSAVRAALS